MAHGDSTTRLRARLAVRRGTRAMAAGLAALVPVASCGDDGGQAATDTAPAPVIDPGDEGRYDPALDPASVVPVIDNPYLPLLPGARWVYDGVSEGQQERIEVVVTDERREVMGIDAVVVRDTVTAGGELVEDTYDWFAQDTDGNVWYLGEETAEYEDGKVVSTEGSWEAGVDGALPGIVMLAEPAVGEAYRQEFYEGEAEDLAEVVRLGETATSGGTTYDDVVVIKEWNPLEPEVVEEKSYAPGVGTVLEVATEGGDEHVELVEHVPGG